MTSCIKVLWYTNPLKVNNLAVRRVIEIFTQKVKYHTNMHLWINYTWVNRAVMGFKWNNYFDIEPC